ncbi:histidine kinase-like ATPase [Rhizophagus clarus]|uniref:Histidine kinase-like ATPase n=1 Tax=Rhizophagus clarus TaxID=94130 RepID=A0A8H3LVA3_9GLOM|nr:histidine kinase-like ATPase [Rhizophagus clarus]
MTNTNTGPNAPKGAVGKEFRPREPYTHRLRKILEEYPDGSQILREILQNSDDAKSTEQIFILDHNTYPSNRLINPHLDYEKRDFQSLLKLADSEKHDQFDKIGVMGVGFNSIYHITDSPSFITGDKYVILDPHEWYFRGGIQFDLVGGRLAEHYPDQFAPFRIPCDKKFEGTIFRYPLRNSSESEISKKIYKIDEISEMFRKFYENESINCLLFLKYIECISFYELEKDATEPKLLYKIQLDNAEDVRQERRLIVEKIIPMMDSLTSGILDENQQLEATYVASFSRQKGVFKEPNSKWLILNYLDDLLKTEAYFKDKFKKSIREYKFIPNVGLAVPLENLNATGRLFCFLPLPIEMPFLVSVHGYFAVNTNRRSLWSSEENEDLSLDSLAYLKIEWNKYLFENVLPNAWVKLLRGLPKVLDIQLIEIYKFWPKIGSTSSIASSFCKDLIKNVVENLDIDDCVFYGFTNWLSLNNGYLNVRMLDDNLLKVIGNIGFPVISAPPDIIRILKESKHKSSLKILSPAIIRDYLNSNRARWEDNAISRQEVLQLFEYILSDKKFNELEGFKMIPLANDTFGTLTLSGESYVYIDKTIDEMKNYRNERNSLINQLNSDRLVDKKINPGLYEILYNYAKAGWDKCNLNIKILDEIDVKDLILIISDIGENRELSMNEINNVIEILKRIAKIQNNTRIEGNDLKSLDGLLIPSTENKLVSLDEIQFDDMGDKLSEEERRDYKISHRSINIDLAEELQMQTLKGTIYGIREPCWETYEQYESLTTRIKNILNDYSINSLFKEFLQNADDAGAAYFSIIVDERKMVYSYKKSFFSEEMVGWQGPAIWIYNSAEFTDEDFESLLKLGIGSKSQDDEKIGKFGIGFNCAFNFTDLPSFVSGKYISFLDPHEKFLPAQGKPPRKRRGIRINFKEKNWNFKRRFPDQCRPYEALGCDFSEEFKGTLFRLPLRTDELARQSKISQRVYKISDVRSLFNRVDGIKEMLFLRYIESCSLYRMTDGDRKPQLMWVAKIDNINDCRDDRRKVVNSIDDAPTYQLDIERKDYMQDKQVSEIWAICTGGHDEIESEFDENFSEDFEKFLKEKRLIKPRGGVASLRARSDEKSLDELRDELIPNPPELKGEAYSYLPLSINTNLGVHLNGNFSLPSGRNGIPQSEKDFLQADCDDAKWNKYVLHNVLPDLHVKLLDYIIELEKEKHEQETDYVPHSIYNLWPIKNLTTGLYKEYGLNVIRKLGCEGYEIFWTKSAGGQFISLEDSKIFGTKETVVADILVGLEVPAVKLDENQIEHLNEIVKFGDPFPYVPVTGESVCDNLRAVMHSIPTFTRESMFKLLDFILQDRSSFGILTGLPLVPLSDGSIGNFGEIYYVGKQEHLDLFPNTGSSKFIFTELPRNLEKFFYDSDFCAYTNIKKFDASAISILLPSVLKPAKELKWDPDRETLPNKSWLEKIWSILNEGLEDTDFKRLSVYPLLPMIQPSNMLIRPEANNPLLYIHESVHALFPSFPALIKLKVRITNMSFPTSAHEDFKKCVIECNSENVIDSLERIRSNNSMKRWFEKCKLSSEEYENFRAFIKKDLATLIARGKSQAKFMNVLKSLPIWPLRSPKNKFIDATSGKLLTNKIPFFSFDEKIDFYRCDNESDFYALNGLGVTSINEFEYLEIIVTYITTEFPSPSQDYVDFLKYFLSLGNQELTLFCLEALKRMGLICLPPLPPPPPPPISNGHREVLLNSLLEQLTMKSDNGYHDAIFAVDGEMIHANRYVLLAASKKFKDIFRDNTDNRPIEVNFRQDSFCVFLKLLYGQPFKDAINPILCTADNYEKKQDFKTYYVSFLIDLLKLTVSYEVEPVRIEVEYSIIECQCISVHNLCKILGCLERYDKDQRLGNFYKPLIKSSKILIDEQLLELRDNAVDKSEILQMENMLEQFM